MIDIQPGKRVAVVPIGQGAMTFGVVKSVGKRDIVLESGARFSVRDQTRSVGGTWGTLYRLAAADDPDVVERLTEEKIRRYASQVKGIAQALSAGVSKDRARDVARMATLVGRLGELVGTQEPGP